MNENEIKKLLDEEIANEIRDLSEMYPGEEKSAAVEDLTKLYKLRIEENKSERDAENNMRDDEMKRVQIAEQTKDRYFKLGIAAAELMIPLIFYGVWMRKGFKFEETGTYTSTTFRGLFSRFRPTKK